MNRHPDITLIDFRAGMVEADGRLYPITKMFDEAFDDCDADDAITIVAGSGNYWISLLVEDFGDVVRR